jgi:hypothetical protein
MAAAKGSADIITLKNGNSAMSAHPTIATADDDRLRTHGQLAPSAEGM